MKRVALIIGDQVDNVISVLDGQDVPAGGVVLPEGARVEPGWTYKAGAFTPAPPAPVAPPVVPAEVWTYQAKIVMSLTSLASLGLDPSAFGLAPEASLYDAVLAGIAALPDQARMVATIQLESAPGTRRDAAILAVLAETLGLTDAMIDNLFIAAAAIP